MITIPHNRIIPSGGEADALVEAANAGEWAEGKAVSRVESLFASYFGAAQAICVDSGLSALRLALHSLGLPGDTQVLVPAYSCVALANAPLSLGYSCVPIDANAQWNMDHELVTALDVDASRCAILAVNTFGLPACEALASCGIPMIEDATHGFKVNSSTGKPVISADIAIVSTYSTKLIGGGKGGVILVKDDNIADQLRQNISYVDLEPATWRLNCSMSNLDAALLSHRFEHLPRSILKRNKLAQQYNAAFTPLSELGVVHLPHNFPDRVWYRYCLYVTKKKAGDVISSLETLGIGAAKPVETWHKSLGFSCPEADSLYSALVSIPLYPSLTEEEQQQVIQCVFNVLQ